MAKDVVVVDDDDDAPPAAALPAAAAYKATARGGGRVASPGPTTPSRCSGTHFRDSVSISAYLPTA